MNTFSLRIGTPDGLLFEGQVARVVCRTITGDIAILAKHSNFCTALGMGEAHVVMEDDSRREAACIGGMVSIIGGVVNLVPTTFEWADEIDLQRAEKAKEAAEAFLREHKEQDQAFAIAEAKLKRAIARIHVKG